MSGQDNTIAAKGSRLSRRTRDIAKAHRIEGRQALERYVCESILWAMDQVGAGGFMVTGGLLWDPRDRATGDGDIKYAGIRSAETLYAQVGKAARLLREHGFQWWPGDLEILGGPEAEGNGATYRVNVKCWLGDTRVDTHIDVSFGAYPIGTQESEFRSLFKGPSFRASRQPWEAACADKLQAILRHGNRNTRLKDYADILRMRRMGLSTRAVAFRLHELLEMCGESTDLPGVPDGLSYEFAWQHEAGWRERVVLKDPSMPAKFEDAVCDVRHWYADIAERVRELAAAAALVERVTSDGPALVPSMDNVVSLDRYRVARR